MKQDEIELLLETTGAIRHGHFQLSSSLHSPLYIQCALLFEHPAHVARVADALADRFADMQVDVVAAPALGGIILGYELARQFGARSVFVERDAAGHFALRRFALAPGERVLVVEDVLTTGASARETIEVVRQAGGDVVGVAAIMDRSGSCLDFGVPLRTLLTKKIDTYVPEECPFCREKHSLERPGSRPENKEAQK